MSDPFRSELEAAHEKLRHAEEELEELRIENRRLRTKQPRSPVWTIVALIVVFVGALGLMMIAMAKRSRSAVESMEAINAEETESYEKRLAAQKEELQKETELRQQAETELADEKAREELLGKLRQAATRHD